MAISQVFNMDCLAAMREMPDNAFDLAVVDPPYGGGAADAATHTHTHTAGCKAASEDITEQSSGGLAVALRTTISAARTGGTWAAKYNPQGGVFSRDENGAHFVGRGRSKRYADINLGANIRHWDVAPTQEYFNELARVSKNQIIWGGNYFSLPPTRCFLVWRKLTISENFTMAMAEYAWTSFNDNAKVFEAAPQGNTEKRFHPTQKPVALYAWIYKLFAEKGMKILDTHLGSGSSRIAAYDAGLDFVGYEIDKTYFDLQEERFARHTAQGNLFLQEGIF